MRYITFWILAVILYGIGDTATTFLAVRVVDGLNPTVNFLIDTHPFLLILMKATILTFSFILSFISLRKGDLKPA